MNFDRLQDVICNGLFPLELPSMLNPPADRDLIQRTFKLNIVDLLKLLGRLDVGKGSAAELYATEKLVRAILKIAESEIAIHTRIHADRNWPNADDWFALYGCCREVLELSRI